MNKQIVLALTACAALCGVAQADESWDFGNGEQLIYETDIGDHAVFRLNDGAQEPMWIYIAGGLAGNHTNRTGTYSGFWMLHFDGTPETEAEPCNFTQRSPDGRQSGYWGLAEVEFSAPAFPNQLSLRLGHCYDEVSADASEHAPITPAPAPAPAAPAAPEWFWLQTEFTGGERCLEGSNPVSMNTHNGGAFMDACRNSSGQHWRKVPTSNGAFRLEPRSAAGELCLEGGYAANPHHGGAAFLERCQAVSGQEWSTVEEGDGYVRLRNSYRGADECLEGSRPDIGVHGGAAYMDQCQFVSGQRWRMVPVQ